MTLSRRRNLARTKESNLAKLPKMHDKEPVELYTLDEIQAETTEMEGKSPGE